MMSFIAQIAATPSIPQSENIAIQVLIWVLVAIVGGIAGGIKLAASWFTGMRDEIKVIPKTIIEENSKTREQYAAENAKKIDMFARVEMAVLKLCMKLGDEETANAIIRKNGGGKQ